jgi:hypothetical protein
LDNEQRLGTCTEGSNHTIKTKIKLSSTFTYGFAS